MRVVITYLKIIYFYDNRPIFVHIIHMARMFQNTYGHTVSKFTHMNQNVMATLFQNTHGNAVSKSS